MIKSSSNGDTGKQTVQSMDVTKWNYAPCTNWAEMGDTEHFVQFYEADGFLLNSLSGFIGRAIGADDGALVVATKAHRNGLANYCKRTGET